MLHQRIVGTLPKLRWFALVDLTPAEYMETLLYNCLPNRESYATHCAYFVPVGLKFHLIQADSCRPNKKRKPSVPLPAAP